MCICEHAFVYVYVCCRTFFVTVASIGSSLFFFSLFLRQFKLINFNFELIYGLKLLFFINSCCDTICFIIIYESIMFSCRKNFYIAVFCKCWLSLNSLNTLQYCSRAAIKIIFIVVSIYDSCQSFKHRLKSIEILSYHH